MEANVITKPDTPVSLSNNMSLEQLWWYANQISNSDFVPRGLRGKPLEVFITIQYGATLGVSPLAALHGIAVINGVPSVYGDLLVALMLRHKDFEDQRFEFVDIDGDRTCYCHIKRRGRELFTSKFSMSDARKAGLIDKPVWRAYPDNMLMRRALNTGFHYVFPDALYVGLVTVDSPYGTDNIDTQSLVASSPPIDDKSLNEKIISDAERQPEPASAPYVRTEPKPQSPAANSPPIKLGNVATLPAYDEAFRLIGTANAGRKEIMDFYKDFLECPSDDRLPYYGSLLAILLEYVHNDEVTAKAIALINKYAAKNQNMAINLSDISCGSVDNVPIPVLDKMVARLIRHWIPERISSSELILELSRQLGVSYVKFIAQSEFVTEGPFVSYSKSHKSGVMFTAVSPEARDAFNHAVFERDYMSIEFNYLSLIHHDMVDALNNASPTLSTEFVDKSFIDEFNRKLSEYSIDSFIALNPFCRYPDVQVLRKDLGDKAMRYLEYLHAIDRNDVIYPTNEQSLDIITEAVNNGTDTFGVAIECTGNPHVSISEIPLYMLQSIGYLK